MQEGTPSGEHEAVRVQAGEPWTTTLDSSRKAKLSGKRKAAGEVVGEAAEGIYVRGPSGGGRERVSGGGGGTRGRRAVRRRGRCGDGPANGGGMAAEVARRRDRELAKWIRN
jgi:hypothetical protein